jgi:NitT/TauT family transport system substrate-binding protein
MAFRIMPHGRLHEWVAEQEGYFANEGLEYTFVQAGDYGIRVPERDAAGEIRTGAFETFQAGRDGANVSCACHWATNAAANEGSGQLIASVYALAPCAIMVAPDSPVRRPEDLAGVPVGVGYHSGSHFAALQALEAVLAPGDIKLTFQGPPDERLDALLDRQVPAGAMWGVPRYIAEAFGFRTVLDATFMIGFLVTGDDVDQSDVDKYLAALRLAQMAIDLHPERYKHHHLRAVPEKYRDRVDVRAFGTGERIVFLPYTREAFDDTRRWTQTNGLFPRADVVSVSYDEVTIGGGSR